MNPLTAAARDQKAGNSHHIQPLLSEVLENSVSIECIRETHQGALWSFYLTGGKPGK